MACRQAGGATIGDKGSDAMQNEVWALGATGQTGRAVAAPLAATDVSPVLVGRDATRLTEASTSAGSGARTIVAGSVASMIAAVRRQRLAVVINTIGPFFNTTAPIAQACLPGSHDVDLANDVIAASALLGLHEEAVAAGRILVTGAGFGVLATESVRVAMARHDRCQGSWLIPDRSRPCSQDPIHVICARPMTGSACGKRASHTSAAFVGHSAYGRCGARGDRDARDPETRRALADVELRSMLHERC